MKFRHFAAVVGALSVALMAQACGDSNDGAGGFAATADGSTASQGDGGSSREDGAANGDAAPPLGEPLSVEAGKWNWVDIAGAVCDDGSPTGIGVYPGTANKVLFYFAGGGACWNYDQCAGKSTTRGPYGKTQFEGSVPYLSSVYITDTNPQTNGENPFKDWTRVFVPYCTGDLHGGDLVKTYTKDDQTLTFHHKGRANVAAYLARLAATYRSPEQVAVSGSSAGGGGALLSYPAVRSYWPNATSFLIDDSLPFFVGEGIKATIRNAWFENWNLAPLTTPICGANCVDDLSLFFKGVAAKFPNDRMALLSFTVDPVIANYYEVFGQFTAELTKFTTDVLVPTGNFKYFYVGTSWHTMYQNYRDPNQATNGTTLLSFTNKMISGDASWASVSP